MFSKIKSWFKKPIQENDVETNLQIALGLINSQAKLIRALHFCLEQFQEKVDDLNVIACSLMIDNNSTNKTIESQTVNTLEEEKMELRYIIESNGDYSAWIEKCENDDVDDEEE